MFDVILYVIIGSIIITSGSSYTFGFLDELTKPKYAIDFDFIKICKEDSKELRIIPKIVALLLIYLVEASYASGIYSIKTLRKSFRFLLMKSN